MTDGPTGIDPLVAPTPTVDRETAERVADREFGITGTVSELDGERDLNFRVDADDGEAYVLKVSNPADDERVLDLQTEALRHVAAQAPDLPVMRVVPTTDGDAWTTVEGDDGESYLVRTFTFLEGRRASADELDHPALFDYGAHIARVGRALRGFFHPEARYDILWDLRHAPDLRALLDAVADPDRRDLARRMLDRFDERVAPVFDDLRAQVVHNDLTLDNVLLGDDDRVSGIVDFGDVTHTALVCDLAIPLASVMIDRADGGAGGARMAADMDADPVEGAASVVRGYASVTPLEDREEDLLADLVVGRLVAWVVIASWRVERHPENEAYITGSLADAWGMLEWLDERVDRVARRLRTAARASNVPCGRMASDDLLGRRRAVLGDSPLTYREPVHLVGGDGVWLFDPEGRRYLDAYNNVQVVGHADPDVAAAIGGQARTLATNTRYLHEATVELGERLAATMPDGLDRAVFTNSGSEAVDLAWRLATAHAGGVGAVVSEHAYHGITEASTALSPEVWPRGEHPDHVETVPPPVDDVAAGGVASGGPAGSGSGEPGGHGVAPDEAGAAMDAAIEALEDRGVDPAAFVFDSLFTSDGIRPPSPEGLGRMVDRVREAGGLVIADEVQAGHGRTGDMWGFEAADVVPDVVAMGKPMGNGHPVAAVVTRPEILESLRDRTGLFSTFGGNPVSAAAALAVLDAIEDRELLDHVADVGAYLQEGLVGLAADHDLVGDVRSRGLMVGVELVGADGSPASEETVEVVNAMRQRRVLIGYTGVEGNVLKIRPPLVFQRGHADRLLAELDDVLDEVATGSR